MPQQTWSEILEAYERAARSGSARPLALALACLVLATAWRTAAHQNALPSGVRVWLRRVLLGAAIAFGLWLVLRRASVFDDAYISFRYAQNLLDGHGLVWNPGERVEGYTNFLWTMLVAALVRLTSVEAPLVAVVASMACYVLNLLAVHRLSDELTRTEDGPSPVPIAVCLLAVQNTFVDYGTSGLETQCSSLLVTLGALALARGTGPRQAAAAGSILILATLTRPDHAIFYVAGAAAVAAFAAPGLWRARGSSLRELWRAGGQSLAAYAAPFALYAVYLAWKVQYYGSILPNTFYAKAADHPYYSQGLVFATVFYLASHFWVVASLWFVWLVLGPRDPMTSRLKLFTLLAVVPYHWYVLRVGGDFMHGRFFVTLTPLLLVPAEQFVQHLGRGRRGLWPRVVAVGAAAALVATAGGLRLIGEREIRWHIAEESSFYRIKSWFPVVVDHYNYNAGRVLQRLKQTGVEPVVATRAIGMVGFYSRLQVIDEYGLTDPIVARQKIGKTRDRPGHERRASWTYLEKRGVDIARRMEPPAPYRDLARVYLGPNTGGSEWYFLRYDRNLARAMRRAAPQLRFRDFEEYLDDYIEELPRSDIDVTGARQDARWFRSYYFDHNHDPVRWQRLEDAIAQLGRPRAGAPGTAD